MQPPRLLIVDDEPRIREFFMRFFSAEGWWLRRPRTGYRRRRFSRRSRSTSW